MEYQLGAEREERNDGGRWEEMGRRDIDVERRERGREEVDRGHPDTAPVCARRTVFRALMRAD